MSLPLPKIRVAVGVAKKNTGEVLLGQRRLSDAFMPGAWEFPGGKIELLEKPEEALRREIQEELAIGITEISAWKVIEWSYPKRLVELNFMWMILETEEISRMRPLAHTELRWVRPEEALASLELLPANIEVMKALS